jgi:uncharacterized glyoxalase superfamily protein PhnB
MAAVSRGKIHPRLPVSGDLTCRHLPSVPDIEAHYARARAAGAKIERPLAESEYGSREYSARDCDGHLWSFGTYDPYAES